MYYKIENKECDIYKELHALRTYEKKIEKENIEAIKEAEKRGFIEGAYYKNLEGLSKKCGVLKYGWDGLHSTKNDGMIFQDGKWATVVEKEITHNGLTYVLKTPEN